jgi:hypothetical protein
MTNHQDAMRAGNCPDCGNKLHHGAYTQQQIQDAANDMGMPAEEFYDCCDQCFVDEIAHGDATWAEELAGRKLDVQHSRPRVGGGRQSFPRAMHQVTGPPPPLKGTPNAMGRKGNSNPSNALVSALANRLI